MKKILIIFCMLSILVLVGCQKTCVQTCYDYFQENCNIDECNDYPPCAFDICENDDYYLANCVGKGVSFEKICLEYKYN